MKWGESGTRVDLQAGPDPFADLPALADRLGVDQYDPNAKEAASVVLRLKDGRSWSLFSLINALLDRMDDAA